MTKEEQICQKAREIGFDAVGITTAQPPNHNSHQAAWLAVGMHGEMGYLQNRNALRSGSLASPNLLSETQSVIVVALSYHFDVADSQVKSQNDPTGVVARYAHGLDYHTIMWEKLKQLGGWVESTFPGTLTRGFCDSGPIRERELAARAGIGWQGKHTNLISLELGNWFFLGALLTTLPLQSGGYMENRCGTCTRCLAACPTGALVAPLTLDARRCISYLTIELKGAIPRELRPLIGNRIFGCDDCLAACPWNERAKVGRETRLAARATDAGYPDLLSWLALLAEETAFKAKFVGTPLLRPKREGLRRNVCIALGNVGGTEAIMPLCEVLQTDPSPIVRGAAAWALGEVWHRTDSQGAYQGLLATLEIEEDTTVREEISAVIDSVKT